jgi:hypothetical protein
MKRCVLRVLVFLMIGVVANIAVAWMCANYAKTRNVDRNIYLLHSPEYSAPSVPAEVLELFPPGWLESYRASHWRGVWLTESVDLGCGITAVEITVDPYTARRRNERHFVCTKAAGWPWRALRCSLPVFPEDRNRVQDARRVWKGATRISEDTSGRAVLLPLLPIWKGFALNALLFGGLAVSPVVLWITARRCARRCRHLCADCGYPIGPNASTR